MNNVRNARPVGGNKSAIGSLEKYKSAESSGVEYIDITLPGPFVADPSVPDER